MPLTMLNHSLTPLTVTVLGCGTSTGVPVAGYDKPFWGDCDPHNPYNRRTRPSIYVQAQGKGVLVDTTPDLRHHLLEHGLTDLEHIIITHHHADHVHGINDISPLYFTRGRQPLPLWADAGTLQQLQSCYTYLFQGVSIYPQILEPVPLPQHWQWQGLSCQSFRQHHGAIHSQGLRFGSVVYSTDFIDLDDQALACLEGLDLWIVDCRGRTPKPTHCHLELTLKWIERVKPKAALLTHMNQELDFDTLVKELPPHIRPAYDGLKIHLTAEGLNCPLF